MRHWGESPASGDLFPVCGSGHQAFLDDRERDNELMALGLEVLRFTDLRIDKEPARVAAIVWARLDAARK
jgi:very-short-patch-repair endonuclease